jgi:deoxyribodipyrimidine photolyase
MSGETEKSESAWTTDTLREHFAALLEEADKRYEQRFTDQDAAVKAALAAAEKAVVKAETASEKRFDAVNEFRQTVNDIVNKMMPRSEAENSVKANADKIDALATRIDRTEGRSTGLNAGWVYLVAGIGLLATIVSIITAVIVFARR